MLKNRKHLLIILLLVCTSCNEAGNFLSGNIIVRVNDQKKPSILNVKVQNDQLIVTGSDLDSVTLARIDNHEFQIESKSSDKLILNAKSTLSFLVGGALNLVVSNANASATFPLSFELQNGQVTASKLHHMGASTGEFLQFNGSTWEPASINTNQVYVGVYNAATDTPNISAAVAAAGTYYIVTTAGAQDLGSGLTNFDVGDWVISDGTNWSKVSVGTNTVSNFNGRTGAVVPLSGDYSWSMLTKAAGKLTGSKLQEIADIDAAGIQDGDILQWNAGTSKWEVNAVPTPVIGAGSISNTQIANGAIDSNKIVDGTIVNADISATAAIDQSKINGLTTALSNKEGTITAGTAAQYWSGTKSWQNFNPAVIGSVLTGFSSTTGAVTATDTLLTAFNKLTGNLGVVAASQGNYVLKAGDTMSGPLAMGNNKITDLATPTVGTDAATKDYVDSKAGTASQWTTVGSNIHYSTGNVGIGTSAPAAALNIVGDGSAADDIVLDSFSATPSAGPAIFVNRARGTSGTPSAVLAGDTLGLLSLRGFDGAAWATGAAIVSRPETNWTTTASTKNAYLAFHTLNSGSGAEKMRISSAGNLGIGTTTPFDKLSVIGNIGLSGGVRMKSDTVNYVELLAPAGLASNLSFRLPASAGSSGHALITDGAGNLSWSAVSSGTPADGSIGYAKLNLADGDIPLAKLAGTSDATKYLKGDKTWGTFITDVLASTFATVTPSNTAIANGDSLSVVVNKTQGQINSLASNSLNKTGTDSITGTLTINPATGGLKIPATPSGVDLTDAANVQYVQNYVGTYGQWIKTISDIGYSAGRVGVGTTSPASLLHLVTDNHDTLNIDSYSSGNVNYSAGIVLRRGRGTVAAPTGALAGDRIGFLGAYGTMDNGAFHTTASSALEFYASENQTTTARGGHIVFGTVAKGTGSRKERLRIADSGYVGIGSTAPESLLHLTSSAPAPIALGSETSILLQSDASNAGTQGYIGSLWFGSKDGALEGSTKAAGIIGYMAEDVTPTSAPADLLFMTTPTGTLTALERMKITSAGNVGIGTSAPGAKLVVSENASSSPIAYGGRQLHIVGADGANAGIQIDGYGTNAGTRPVISFRQAGGTGAVPTPSLANDVLGSFGWWGRGPSGYSSTQRAEIRVDASQDWTDTAHGTVMIFKTTANGSTTNNERMRIENNGNVGIGTAAPQASLEINSSGNTIINNSLSDDTKYTALRLFTLRGNPLETMGSANPSGGNRGWELGANGNTYPTTAMRNVFTMNHWNGTAWSTPMAILPSGNIGIGTVAPVYKLQVNKTAVAAPALMVGGGFSGGPRIQTYGLDQNPLAFMGLGSDMSGESYDHSIYTSGPVQNGKITFGQYDGTTYTERMRVNGDGNIGIGITTPGYKLHVNGSVAGVGAYNALSDRRYKKDFQKIPDALQRVVSLNGFFYKWRQEEHPDMQFEKGRDMGVIAQEVQKVFPEAVSTDKKSGFMSVAYSKLIAPIIEAIKELFSQSQKHEREIASLKEENRLLKESLCEINPKAKICKVSKAK